MPNRDHDDTPYNRSEGRFEATDSGRDEERSPYQREQSYRSSRDWERGDFRGGGRVYPQGYNPARDENDYRGGSRFEDRVRYQPYDGNRGFEASRGYDGNRYEPSRFDGNRYEGNRNESYRSEGNRNEGNRGYDTSAWDDDARWRERLRGNDWDRTDTQRGYGRGTSGSQGGYGAQGGYSSQNFSQGNFGGSAGSGARSGYGSQSGGGGTWGGHDWNRDYTRDWDRDYRGDWNRGSNATQNTRGQDEGDFGDQLRHAGRQLVGKVKRAFRGPRGYKRSDERIREDVNDRLAHQDELDPSDIEVRVENGEVTLTGSVRSRHEKFRAEEIADDVSGVNDVHNQLRIGSVQTGQTLSTGAASSTTPNMPISRNGRA